MRNKRFVLDTNIWISYFISNQEKVIADIISKNKIAVFYCDELIDEVTTVLTYPHLAKRNVDIKKAVKLIKEFAGYYSLIKPIKNYIPGDDADNYIIALALQTNAGFVTSGDKHILSQKEILETTYRKLQIITKVEAEQMFISKK